MIVIAGPLLHRMELIYQKMENEYDKVAAELGFSCEGCPDNCCDSYFEHHTCAEWSYLWLGFSQLPDSIRQEILARAEACQRACEEAIGREERPQVMCPLNREGRCILYRYRLMVCRTHGVPAVMTRPDGRTLNFPGCFRCQEVVRERCQDQEKVPTMERTALLRKLALLENDLLEGRRHLLPKVRLTIAQMLLQGPPVMPVAHCRR
ncbi:MAG: hypothetical protein P4L42_16545 [Desulfocapsaceae bacterium]|nr:hypothetical protein [Desulfocapsaceae bacterium]